MLNVMLWRPLYIEFELLIPNSQCKESIEFVRMWTPISSA